jgi:DNA invertase Pin-like site-specific DNA recombinase
MHQRTFVSYLRVSTERQGRSGLGLEAQRDAVATYLNGGSWKLIAEFLEVESGKRNDRPKLECALRTCRVHNATLVIAKLDRLARNVAFVSNLMESNVDFVAVDFPEANRLTIHILAAVAEHEAKAISERTKAALAAAKKRGVSLGGFRGTITITAEARLLATQAIKARADARANDLIPFVRELQAQGFESLSALARELSARGVPTPRGKAVWNAAQVANLLKRACPHRPVIAA